MVQPWLRTIVLASALCVAYLIGVIINWSNAADRSLYANLGMIPIGLTATILTLRASRSQANPRSRWAWSLADAGYLAYYPLAFAGLMCFPSLPVNRRRSAMLRLVCFVLVLGGAMGVLFFFLLPTLQSSRDDLFAYALSVGYPVGDLFLLAGIARVLMRRLSGLWSSAVVLAAGLIVGLAADVVYGYQSVSGAFQSGGLPDAMYMVSWTLFAWAGFAEQAWGRVGHRAKGGSHD